MGQRTVDNPHGRGPTRHCAGRVVQVFGGTAQHMRLRCTDSPIERATASWSAVATSTLGFADRAVARVGVGG